MWSQGRLAFKYPGDSPLTPHTRAVQDQRESLDFSPKNHISHRRHFALVWTPDIVQDTLLKMKRYGIPEIWASVVVNERFMSLHTYDQGVAYRIVRFNLYR